MIKAPITLQELRGKIYVKAKSESQHRFWGLYAHICKPDILRAAYQLAKSNGGAPGIDGVTFSAIELEGLLGYLEKLGADLLARRYQPASCRKVKILKADGKSYRELKIPTIRDRVVQGALKLILEPIFEADFQEGSYGYRPKRDQQAAIKRLVSGLLQKKTHVIDLDIAKYFDTVRSDILMRKLAERVQDDAVLHLVRQILKASGKRGLSQGGPLSPLLSNLYLTGIDKMLEKAKAVTQTDGYTRLDYVRWADDIVILVDQHKQHTWLIKALMKRLQEELGKLGLTVHPEKTRLVNFADQQQSFQFLGFDFRGYRSIRGKDSVRRTPKLQSRIKLQRKIKAAFAMKRGRPVKEVVDEINPMIRGWVNYFRIGNSSRCFGILKTWIELKVRRHVAKAKQRPGFGWKQWSTQQLYQQTGLYNDYRIRYR